MKNAAVGERAGYTANKCIMLHRLYIIYYKGQMH